MAYNCLLNLLVFCEILCRNNNLFSISNLMFISGLIVIQLLCMFFVLVLKKTANQNTINPHEVF